MAIVFHRTTSQEALRIIFHGFRSQENPPRVYVSNREKGQAEGYGNCVLHISIPDEYLQLDDEFPDGERHYAIAITDVNKFGEVIKRDIEEAE